MTTAFATHNPPEQGAVPALPDVRTLRRSRGLSQVNFADLMGVSQPTVSRWERGTEAISFAQRMRMLDIFLNKRGELNPLLESTLRSVPNMVVVARRDLIYLAVSERHWVSSDRRAVSGSDLVGRCVRSIYRMDYRRELFGKDDYSERNLLMEWEHDLIGAGPLDGYRGRTRTKIIQLNLEGFSGPLNVCFSEPRPSAIGEPSALYRTMTLADLDCRP